MRKVTAQMRAAINAIISEYKNRTQAEHSIGASTGSFRDWLKPRAKMRHSTYDRIKPRLDEKFNKISVYEGGPYGCSKCGAHSVCRCNLGDELPGLFSKSKTADSFVCPPKLPVISCERCKTLENENGNLQAEVVSLKIRLKHAENYIRVLLD